LTGESLEAIVDTISSDKNIWLEDLVNISSSVSVDKRPPIRIAGVTYVSFIAIGLIPLSIYIFDFFKPVTSNMFLISSGLTALGFVIIGWLKSYVNNKSVIIGIIETLALGVIAAVVAYFVGDFLENLIAG